MKILSLTLVSSIISSASVSAYNLNTNGNSIEQIEYQDSTDEDFVPSTNVFAQIGSIYKVTIPKVIVLSGVNKKASYYVNVEGDISGYETINVVPEEKVDLYSSNKDVQEGIISQDKTSWTYSTLSVKANGMVEALGLSAGKWSGVFYFNIDMNKVLGDVIDPEHVHNEDTITKTVIKNKIEPTCTKDGSYDEVLYCKDCNEELSRSNKTIDALGHDYVNGICSRCNDEDCWILTWDAPLAHPRGGYYEGSYWPGLTSPKDTKYIEDISLDDNFKDMGAKLYPAPDEINPEATYGPLENSSENNNPVCTQDMCGDKRIIYMKPDGTLASANPFVANTEGIKVKRGTKIYFQMYAEFSSTYVSVVDVYYGNNMVGNAQGYSRHLLSIGLIPPSDCTLAYKDDYYNNANDGSNNYRWYVTFNKK